jgi:type IV pilus assembly protein PilQ
MFKTMQIHITAILGMLGFLLVGLAQANSIQSVLVSQGEGESRIVKVTLKEGLAKLPMHFTTANPNRIVLDFADTDSAIGRASDSLETGIVRAYNVVEASGRTRVVINLAGPAKYDVRKDKNLLLVSVRGESIASAVQAKGSVDEGKPLSHSIQNIDFKRGKDGDGRIEVTLSEPGVSVDVKQKGQTVQVDFPDTALPKTLQRRMDVSDFGTSAQSIEALQKDKYTRMVITPKGKWDYFAYQTGQTFVVEIKSLESAAALAAAQPRYTGEKLSLSFHDEDVNALLKVIADFTGLNIVASETVKGKITLRLVDVPWDHALDIILRAKGLDKRVTGNVIWVAPRDELAAKEKQELEAKQQAEDIGELQAETIRLNYMRASEAQQIVLGNSLANLQAGKAVTCATAAAGVGGTLQQGAQGTKGEGTSNSMISKRGSATFDLKTNSLFIYDTTTRIEKIRKLLSQIDVPARQVMIEARVVVANDGFSRDLGAKLSLNDAVGAGIGNFQVNNFKANSNPGPLFMANPAGGNLGMSILHTATGAVLDLELRALEQDNQGKVLSNPRVVTQNQQPAVILQGQQLPYLITDAQTGQTTYEFKDALLCLLVDPQILNNDEIILDVEIQKDARGRQLVANASEIPIDTKRVKTNVRVKSGETVVLGGIFEQETASTTNKVPLLGEIPLLGWLFKTNNKEEAKTELIIFLTPRLISEDLSRL